MEPKQENCTPLSQQGKEWFETWFDSPYYHILYQHRDDKEAEHFLDSLNDKLDIPVHSRVLDVACGKGRHSIYLNKKGLDVTGFDLSAESIAHNKQFENDSLEFYRHDMRHVFRVNYFDYVLNLFSSFGYFDSEHDNLRCMQANATALKKNGIFVMDYFNAAKIRKNGNQQHQVLVNGIKFLITKTIVDSQVIKKISFEDKGKKFQFEEHVWLFSAEKFQEYFRKAGLKVTGMYGNYSLDPYDENTSERLILIGTKL